MANLTVLMTVEGVTSLFVLGFPITGSFQMTISIVRLRHVSPLLAGRAPE
jgi:hypothetical protein